MSVPVPGQGVVRGFWIPGLPCFPAPWVVPTSPAQSVQGNLTQLQRFQETLLGCGVGWMKPHTEWGDNSYLKACLASPSLGSFVSLRPHWPSLGFSKVPLHTLFPLLGRCVPHFPCPLVSRLVPARLSDQLKRH